MLRALSIMYLIQREFIQLVPNLFVQISSYLPNNNYYLYLIFKTNLSKQRKPSLIKSKIKIFKISLFDQKLVR